MEKDTVKDKTKEDIIKEVLDNVVDKDLNRWNYLKQYVPDWDCSKISTDYRDVNNVVGHQQRAFIIYWAVKEHQRTGGIGLEPGCGQVISPFCIGTDYYAGNQHPVYGGAYWPHIRCLGEILPFKNETFDFIVSHHSLEHMRDIISTIKEWLRVLKKGGKIVIVTPDSRYGPFGDTSHISEVSPDEFELMLHLIPNIRILEQNTFKNNFSFNSVIEKI